MGNKYRDNVSFDYLFYIWIDLLEYKIIDIVLIRIWEVYVLINDNKIIDFNRNENKKQLLEILEYAEDDIENGRIAPIEDSFESVRKMLLDR